VSQSILLVEDNEDDIFIMRRALQAAGISNPLHIAEDGEAAIRYLSGQGQYVDRSNFPLPGIIFLDLQLPYKSGHEVLGWIRERPELDKVVVIVLTSSEDQVDLKKAYALGANSYLVKPPTAEQLVDMNRAFGAYWLKYNRFEQVPG
jgi:CheY-like chemotaxis protein